MFSPRIKTSPSLGCSKPAIMRRLVVLPQPDGPRMERNSPALTARLFSTTAATSPKRLVTFLNSMTGCSKDLSDACVSHYECSENFVPRNTAAKPGDWQGPTFEMRGTSLSSNGEMQIPGHVPLDRGRIQEGSAKAHMAVRPHEIERWLGHMQAGQFRRIAGH